MFFGCRTNFACKHVRAVNQSHYFHAAVTSTAMDFSYILSIKTTYTLPVLMCYYLESNVLFLVVNQPFLKVHYISLNKSDGKASEGHIERMGKREASTSKFDAQPSYRNSHPLEQSTLITHHFDR